MIKKILLSFSFSFFIISCGGSSSSTLDITNTEPIEPISISSSPTQEEYYKYQWQFNEKNNIFKQNYNINNDSHINIEKAWDITLGAYQVGENKDSAVKVAIIDDNFDTNHPEIKDNIFITYNSKTKTSNVSPSQNEESHGTSVASFIASSLSTSSKSGITGVAPQAKLALISIDFENGTLDEILDAYDFVLRNDIKILNCSWGSTTGVSYEETLKLQELKDAGVTVIFASGNGDSDGIKINLDNPAYNDESEQDSVIGVGASGIDNDVTSYSNYGSNIDILAPGGNSSMGLVAATYNQKTNASFFLRDNYSFLQGTSFSAPITTGIIALMHSVNPNLTPDEIRNILISTSDKVGTHNNASYDANGFDIFRAYGKINAYEALIEAQNLYIP